MVRTKGIEPLRHYWHPDLNRARLPISPRSQNIYNNWMRFSRNQLKELYLQIKQFKAIYGGQCQIQTDVFLSE